MGLGSLLFITGLLILVIAFVTRPLVSGAPPKADTTDQILSGLLAEQERILTALLELDFDHQMEKVPEETYAPQRDALVLRGAEILRKLDETGKGGDSLAEEMGSDVDRQLETLIAARKMGRQKKIGKFCHNCGEPLKKADRFCSHCGAAAKKG